MHLFFKHFSRTISLVMFVLALFGSMLLYSSFKMSLKEELKQMSDNCPDDIELHRPYIDAVTIKCPECGEQMHRVPEVIDCWFDSGAMPFAQHHYPFENKEIFEQEYQ